jgi:N6-adenosine-specific RNA methylase IME4
MKKFDLIIADPPYSFSDPLRFSSVRRGAVDNYKVMNIDDICNLPVKKLISSTGAILALWVPSSMLQDGLNIMKMWGFQQKQTFVWVKSKKEPYAKLTDTVSKMTEMPLAKKVISKIIDKFKLNEMLGFGMGKIFRNCHEICLVGISDSQVYKKIKNKSQRSVCIAPNLGHSIKPNDLHEAFNLMLGKEAKKIEIFARRQYPGYTCVGNEIDGLDIREALAKLL